LTIVKFDQVTNLAPKISSPQSTPIISRCKGEEELLAKFDDPNFAVQVQVKTPPVKTGEQCLHTG